MATSAFKSTSRSGGAESKAPESTANKRRSHSVSAVSRIPATPQLDRSCSTIPSEFPFTRENALFWGGTSPPDYERNNGKPKTGNSGEIASSNGKFSAFLSACKVVNEQRGRSVTRNSHEGVGNGIGSSLSRVRGRSLSRGHFGGGSYEGGSYESEAENMVPWVDARKRNAKKISSVRNEGGRIKNARLSMIQNQAGDWSEDDSTMMEFQHVFLSEAEEKTVEAIPKQMKAFQRNNVGSITATNVVDIPPDLLNPGDIELILDIRREYASKLEESEERARKLRADLAIEEHRGQELDRILKDLIPEPKNSTTHRSRPGRRTSSERKRISQRLTEEALAYFDECVSLSTFDSSDFSASEDLSYTTFGVTTPRRDVLSLQKDTLSVLSSNDHGSGFHPKQLPHSFENSALTAHSSSDVPRSRQEYRFSFDCKEMEDTGAHQDIRSYIKNFGRDSCNDTRLEVKDHITMLMNTNPKATLRGCYLTGFSIVTE